jgi:VanZ family protein
VGARAAVWLPSFAYMALIWVLSSLPLVVPVGIVPFRDKGVHFVEYGVLAWLNARAMLRSGFALSRRAALGVAFLVTAAWGLLDEIHQAFVPSRSSDWRDVLADWIGAALAVLLVQLLQREKPSAG